MTPEDIYHSVRFGLAQNLMSGITTVHDFVTTCARQRMRGRIYRRWRILAFAPDSHTGASASRHRSLWTGRMSSESGRRYCRSVRG